MNRKMPARGTVLAWVGACLIALSGAVFGAPAGSGGGAEEATGQQPVAGETAEAPLPPKLLDARRILLLDTTMDFALSTEFRNALEAWDRYQEVFTPDEADVCFALSTHQDFTREEVPTGNESQATEEGLRPRAKATVRVIDKLYFKVFVPGEGNEPLWRDEVDASLERPAHDLVDHLRARIEAAEATEGEGAADGS